MATDRGGGLYSRNLDGTLRIENSTISANRTTADYGYGGGLYGSTDSGTIVLLNSTVSGNSTEGYEAHGGGVYTFVGSGTTTVSDSTISNNSTGGVAADGGGLNSSLYSGTFTIENSTVSGNTTEGEDARGGGIWIYHSSGTTTIEDSTISDNSTAGDSAEGGGVWMMTERGTLSIENSMISDNSTGGKNADGGGLYISTDSGTTTISNSTISNNSTAGDDASGGGVWAYSSSGTTTIEDSTISNNSTGGEDSHGGGGMIFSNRGQVGIQTSTISGNSTAGDDAHGGGAIIYTGYGTISIENSTISGNSTSGDSAFGGGLYSYNWNGTVTISNSTISNNSTISDNTHPAYFAHGGGLVAMTFGGSATTTIANSTIADNSATGQGGGAVTYSLAGTTTLRSTIIGQNSSAVNFDDLWDVAGNINAEFSLIQTSAGHQVDNTTPPGGPIDNDNILDQEAKLDELADNGGPTQTHALLSSSPAIDKGSNPDGLPFDQRGPNYDRVRDGQADMGAFEGTAYVVDNLVDENDTDYGVGDLSLREAIGFAEYGDKIVFADDLNDLPDAVPGLPGPKNFIGDTGTINIDPANGEFTINRGIIINGDNRITIDGGDNNRIFNVDDGDPDVQRAVTLAGLTMQNGYASWANGGAVINRENLTISGSTVSASYAYGDGGGIFNSGTVTVTNSTVSGNKAKYYGGGISNSYSGTAIISQSTISNNSAEYNAGGGIHNSGTLTISESTISENDANESGGGINTSGMTTINNSTISDNSARYNGGGINNSYGTLTVDGSTISGNQSIEENGGGISNSYSGTATITDSTISGNSAEEGGGGITTRGTLTIQNSTISGNWLTYGGGGGIEVSYGTTTIKNSTIANNTTGIYGNGGGVFLSKYGTTDIVSTIIGDNTAAIEGNDLFHEAGGTLNVDHSLIESDDTGHAIPDSSASGDGLGNIVGLDPRLGPLANNGGPTQTHLLYVGSPALNSGSNPDGLTTDQRGEARDDGSGIDMGAFEDPTGNGYDPTPPAPAVDPVPADGEELPPTELLRLAFVYSDGEQFIDFIGKEYSSWPSFFIELEAYYAGSANVLMDFLADLEVRYGETRLFWLEELIPIFEHDPLFEPILLEMGLLLGDGSNVQHTSDTGETLISIDGRADLDWYQGINQRLKKHPAFESEVDKLLGGILG